MSQALRSLMVSGTKIGTINGTDVWVQDGRIWFINGPSSEMKGDYYEFCHEVSIGLHPDYRRTDDNLQDRLDSSSK